MQPSSRAKKYTIVSANTDYIVLTARTSRLAIEVQNLHATADIYMAINADATTNGHRIPAGETYRVDSPGAVHLASNTANTVCHVLELVP